MLNLGIVRPGSTVYIPFSSFAAASGAPSTISGLAVGDIKIYKNGGTTERGSTNGFALLDTDGIDFDSITGLNGFSIDLSDNSTSGFYLAGGKYWVVISAVTIDTQTVNFIAAYFEIGYPQAVLNTTIASLSSQTSFTLSAGAAENDAYNNARIIIHNRASGVQVCRGTVLDYVGGTKTITLAADPAIFTMAAGDNVSIIDFPLVAGQAALVASILEEALAGHAATGNTAKALQDAAASGDPLATAVPGSYGAGTAGAKIGALPSSPAAVGSAMTLADNAIAEAKFAADASKYQALISVAVGAIADTWTVIWHKNGEPVVSGITSPSLWVYKADGSDLIGSTGAPQVMTQIGTTGTYMYAPTVNRIAPGVAYFARAKATIDGSVRSSYRPISRDV